MAKIIHNNDRHIPGGSAEERFMPKLVSGSSYGKHGTYSLQYNPDKPMGLRRAKELRKLAGMSKRALEGKYE